MRAYEANSRMRVLYRTRTVETRNRGLKPLVSRSNLKQCAICTDYVKDQIAEVMANSQFLCMQPFNSDHPLHG